MKLEYYDKLTLNFRFNSANKIEDIQHSIEEIFEGYLTEPETDFEFPIQYKITVTVEKL